MAILGLGADIVSIARIEQVTSRHCARFVQKILSEYELICYKRCHHPIRFLARRFAVKEAAAKALGVGIRNGVSWRDFETHNDALGKPYLVLHAKAAKIAVEKHVQHYWVSISDEREYAIATVIFEL